MILIVSVIGAAGLLAAQQVDDPPRRSSVQQRGPIAPSDKPIPRDLPPPLPAVYPDEFRPLDGYGTNPAQFNWGAPSFEMLRMVEPGYPDGVGDVLARDTGPGPREISNALCSQPGPMPNSVGASDFVWQWGQFLDHDLVETPIRFPEDTLDIPVPAGDPHFDPQNTGVATIAFDRSAFGLIDGCRQQLNNITAYIDGTNVYSNDDGRIFEMRTQDGTGRMRTSPGDLLPFNTEGFPNAPGGSGGEFFLGGDIRANEQVGLTALHTLFVREHNYWADRIAAEQPALDGDEIYERARSMVIAELQAITYNEFLPIVLGPDALPAHTGFDPAINPGISNVFATAAYRFGHTMLPPELLRLEPDGTEHAAGHLPLADAFFVPSETIDHGIDPVLRGLAAQRAQTIDTRITDAVRNFLFGAPGAGGFDLASLNIQRGRDHGIGSYNDVRVAYGLPLAVTFADVTSDASLAGDLAAVYGTVDAIDPWIGMLAEDHVAGAMVGETAHAVMVEQFTRLRDGDRFWYTTYLPPQLVDEIDQTTLAAIIRRNTGIGDELGDDVFRVGPQPCGPGDVTTQGAAPGDSSYGVPDGSVTGADINYFVNAWVTQELATADVTTTGAGVGDHGFGVPDGTVTAADINYFVNQWVAGCP